jgi:hypothetical protein
MNHNATPSVQNWGEFVQWLTPHLKQHYSVEEFAREVNRRPFTVREWCRLGRLHATKSNTQSGPTTLWVISHTELERFRREGLLPRAGSQREPVDVAPIVARARRSRRN